jgi:hypothetical protein
VPCKEYEQLKYLHDTEMNTWARYTYPENRHLRGVDDQQAKQLAKEARARATQKGKEMHWHRECCEECKRDALS